MTVDLYNAADVKNTREHLYALQKGCDPILKEQIKLSDAVLDHDHSTQHCRAALHRQTNAFEGLCFNAYRRCLQWVTDKPLPEILRGLADYLEKDYSKNPYHNAWLKRVTTDFRQLKADHQKKVLIELDTKEGANSTERLNLFKKVLLTKEHGYDKIRSIINNAKDVDEN